MTYDVAFIPLQALGPENQRCAERSQEKEKQFAQLGVYE